MESDMPDAFPLAWPFGWPRTPAHKRKHSQFGKYQSGAYRKTSTRHKEISNLLHEIKLLGGRLPVISSNLKLRQDGLPRSSQREPDDNGIAVYFMLKDRQMCFACDQFIKDWENIRAIALTINALRGIERWGASDMMERAFSGFAALPPAGPTAIGEAPWYEVLGFDSMQAITLEMIDVAYREKAKVLHPDVGGDPDDMARLNRARDRGREVLGK